MVDGIIPSYGGPVISHVVFRRQLGERGTLARYHQDALRQGHVAALPIHVESFDDIWTLLADVEDSKSGFEFCEAGADIQSANAKGKVALLLAPGYSVVADRPERLLGLRRLGAVMFPMSLNTRNLLADGCGEREAAGLSRLGIEVVQMLDSLKIALDVSHLSDRAFWDVVEISTRPLLASHSNARAVCDNPRNLTDDQARAIAKTGGCIGVSVHPSMLASEGPSIEHYIDHIMHFVRLVGTDHVCLGADFIDFHVEFVAPKLRPGVALGIYGNEHVAEGLSGFADLSRVPELLRGRRLADTDIAKISCANFLRLIS